MRARWWLVGLGIVIGLVLLSPLASPAPDGLERVASQHGFIGRAVAPLYTLIPDYAFPGVGDPRLATVVSGLAGAAVTFGVAYGLAVWLRRSRNEGGGNGR